QPRPILRPSSPLHTGTGSPPRRGGGAPFDRSLLLQPARDPGLVGEEQVGFARARRRPPRGVRRSGPGLEAGRAARPATVGPEPDRARGKAMSKLSILMPVF